MATRSNIRTIKSRQSFPLKQNNVDLPDQEPQVDYYNNISWCWCRCWCWCLLTMRIAGKLKLWWEGEQRLKAVEVGSEEIWIVFGRKIARTSGRPCCSTKVFLVILIVFFFMVFLVVLLQNRCFTRTKKRKKVSKKDSKEAKEVSGLKYNISYLIWCWQSKIKQPIDNL